MSNVMEKLIKIRNEYRHLKNANLPFVSFVISEIEKIGKNSGNRETTNIEAEKALQKMVATIEENIKLSKDEKMTKKLEDEKAILTPLLPTQMSEEALKEIISDLNLNSIQEYAKTLKFMYGNTVDMKKAMVYINEHLKG